MIYVTSRKSTGEWHSTVAISRIALRPHRCLECVVLLSARSGRANGHNKLRPLARIGRTLLARVRCTILNTFFLRPFFRACLFWLLCLAPPRGLTHNMVKCVILSIFFLGVVDAAFYESKLVLLPSRIVRAITIVRRVCSSAWHTNH